MERDSVLWLILPTDVWNYLIWRFLSEDIPATLALGATSKHLRSIISKVTWKNPFKSRVRYFLRNTQVFGRNSNLLVCRDGACKSVSTTQGVLWSFQANRFLHSIRPSKFPAKLGKYYLPLQSHLACIDGEELVSLQTGNVLFYLFIYLRLKNHSQVSNAVPSLFFSECLCFNFCDSIFWLSEYETTVDLCEFTCSTINLLQREIFRAGGMQEGERRNFFSLLLALASSSVKVPDDPVELL